MRFSFSRLNTFRKCPKQWQYKYKENLQDPTSEEALIGQLFHEAVEELYNPEKEKTAIQSWHNAVNEGLIEKPIGLLEEVLAHYVGHYKDSDAAEVIIGVEAKLTVDMNDPEALEEGEEHDVVYGKIDRIVVDQGLVGVRDTKSTVNKLKWTPDLVRYDPQILLYAAMYDEKAAASVIDFVEIDEVRIAALQEPKINKNGKPSVAKAALDLVTYEAFRAKLEELDLLDDPAYTSTLIWLEKRGHPLFRRTRIYLDDKEIMNASLIDIVATWRMVSTARKEHDYTAAFPRHRTRLCDWCGYKELCQADCFNLTEEERIMYTGKFEIRVDKE